MKYQGPKYTVTIPVKPYVYRFLEINYGVPVNFSNHPKTHYLFRELLKKQPVITKPYQNYTLRDYTSEIEVYMTEFDFYTYGWEISPISVIRFGYEFEGRAKLLMRNMVAMYHAVGLPINLSIQKFQERFDFPEDFWKYEALKKDFYRNGNKQNIDFDNEIFKKLEKIILLSLSDLGTVSKNAINYYD